jgi:hypothetical protein
MAAIRGRAKGLTCRRRSAVSKPKSWSNCARDPQRVHSEVLETTAMKSFESAGQQSASF